MFVTKLGQGSKEWKYPAGVVYPGWDLIVKGITLNLMWLGLDPKEKQDKRFSLFHWVLQGFSPMAGEELDEL